ncbi:MAG: hypothetical protein KDC48_23800, partial [Planctomycetes bacterium]|nr:hypothetical protein [Planctomycetota bacterium]
MSETAEQAPVEPNERDERAAEPRGALWQRIAVGGLSFVIWLVAAMPSWLAYAIGDLLAVPW